MKIALLSPVEENVPPPKYGGTELVIGNICEGLKGLGHEVHLYASGKSKAPAELKTIFEQPIRELSPNRSDARLRETYKYMAIGKLLELLHDEKYDVIHNHIGWRLMSFEKALPGPLLTTLHGPLDVSYIQTVFRRFSKSAYVSISNAQRKPLPELNYTGTVYNGIATGTFEFNETPRDYFAFLGRMSPEKGPKQAIALAKKAGVSLIMAAKVDAVDTEYFEKEIKPEIDNHQIQFIGEVDHHGKVELLKNARGLFAPIQWEEPFGLFVVEAFACGTPVIAYNRGSMSELIVENEVGFLVTPGDEDTFVKRIGQIGQIDRHNCAKHAEQKFSIRTMTDAYLDIYKKIADKS